MIMGEEIFLYEMNSCPNRPECTGHDTHSLPLCPVKYTECPLYLQKFKPDIYKQMFPEKRNDLNFKCLIFL